MLDWDESGNWLHYHQKNYAPDTGILFIDYFRYPPISSSPLISVMMKDEVLCYNVDGIYMHSARRYKPYSFEQAGIFRSVTDATGISGTINGADMVDQRSVQVLKRKTRLEAYLEMIEQRSS